MFCGRAVRASLNLCLLPARHCLAKPTLTFVRRLAPHFGGAEAGGEYRSRTGDLLVANQALSQLS